MGGRLVSGGCNLSHDRVNPRVGHKGSPFELWAALRQCETESLGLVCRRIVDYRSRKLLVRPPRGVDLTVFSILEAAGPTRLRCARAT